MTFRELFESKQPDFENMLSLFIKNKKPSHELSIKNGKLYLDSFKVGDYVVRNDGDRNEYYFYNNKYGWEDWDVKKKRLLDNTAELFSKVIGKPVTVKY
jgi:hypothetical protein